MLTRLRLRNFKRFEDVDIELGRAVILVGPNNSGKTTALQALALWDIGVRRWNEKRKGETSPSKRPGVAINRRDAIQPAFDALLGVVDHLYPIEPADVKRARTLLLGLSPLSARDAVHVAIMQRYEIDRLLSFDAGFDCVEWIERIGRL